MTMLKKVESGVQHRPFFLAVYGVPGIGKTTFAADFDKPIFADLEKGSGHLKVDRISEFSGYEDFVALLNELIDDAQGYKTLVVDTVDTLERFVKERVCRDNKVENIEKIGYGKGYVFAEKYWEELIGKMQILREKMNVILIAHTQIEKVNDPTQAVPYDQFGMKLHKKASAVIQEAVDAILFCAYEVYVKENAGGHKGKAFGEGKRIMHTSSIPGHVAKNRFGLPTTMEMSQAAFTGAVFATDEAKLETLQKKLTEDIPRISDAETQKKAADYFQSHKTDIESLKALDVKVQTAIGV